MTTKGKKRKFTRGLFNICLMAVIGFIVGLTTPFLLDQVFPEDIASGDGISRLCIMLIVLYPAFITHIVIHEAGHLIFGLMAGYRFSSFRIGSHMLIKENQKLGYRKIKITGTGGQCLMIPPEMVDGKIPVILYNLGGSFANLIVTALLIPVFMVINKGSSFAIVVFMLIVVGALTGLCNGIPMRTNTIDNDGYNAISLGKNKETMRAFWIQMKVNEQQTKGVRIKDMPDEWFEVPPDDAMENSMVATIGVLAANRLMDQQRLDEAERLMDHLLEIETGIVPIHRNLLICDRIYLELIGQNRSDRLEELYTKELKRFMKAMKTFPSVIRVKYAYSLLADRDPESADKAMMAFEKVAASYPYPNDILLERELMEMAKNASLGDANA